MDIRSMNLEEMEALAISLGEKAFRGKQLFQWVHEKQAASFDEMTNLSKSLQEKLTESAQKVFAKMYEQTQAAQGAAGAGPDMGNNSGAADDVVDGDYREV